MDIQVIKREGTLEPYDADKLMRVIKAAGFTDEQVTQLRQYIETWLTGLNQPMISSIQIKDQIIPEMKKLNENAADLFIWYEKTKDVKAS